MSRRKAARPIVKWAGGKGQLLDAITRQYPAELGLGIRRYAEPFVGGGAVLFDVLSRFPVDAAYISDTNAALINAYTQTRDNVEPLAALLQQYQDEYLPLGFEQRQAYYYAKRDRYNAFVQASATVGAVEGAALFVFLNRTCFNGLYRVNRLGLYNVPMGVYKQPLICDAPNLRAVSAALGNVEIVCADYRQSRRFITPDTLVYFDPPYRPLTATASFTAYTRHGFGDDEQRDLARYVQELTALGASVIVSNSDPKNANVGDNFFDELYSRQTISRVQAARAINRNGDARGRISELLIRNY